jgi:SHS2 domain-containing protein
MKYEFLEHTADAKFRAYGKTLEEAFENSIFALSDLIAKGNKIEQTKTKNISVKGRDKKSLFYNFLEELIFLVETGFIVSIGKVKIKGNNLEATLLGDETSKYEGLEHIKAPTYAEMRISKKSANRWIVQAVLDI